MSSKAAAHTILSARRLAYIVCVETALPPPVTDGKGLVLKESRVEHRERTKKVKLAALSCALYTCAAQQSPQREKGMGGGGQGHLGRTRPL